MDEKTTLNCYDQLMQSKTLEAAKQQLNKTLINQNLLIETSKISLLKMIEVMKANTFMC